MTKIECKIKLLQIIQRQHKGMTPDITYNYTYGGGRGGGQDGCDTNGSENNYSMVED